MITALKSNTHLARALSLVFASLAATLVLILRVVLTEDFTFIFMTWNLFLAWIPWLISRSLQLSPEMKPMWKWLIIGLWLLFFPNAPYILTDLYHLRPKLEIPLWYDLILLLSFALTGLLLALASLSHIHEWVQQQVGTLKGLVFVAFVAFASAFGVYLGRYLRWNSWDIMVQPDAFFMDIWHHVAYPLQHPKALGFTFGFGAFLLVAYVGYKAHTGEENIKQ